MDQNATSLGDMTAIRCDKENIIKNYDNIGSGDTKFIPIFLTKEEADKAFKCLDVGGDIKYQQWHHMPNKKHDLLPLSRLKIAMTDTDKDGWTPHYRFPVNNQDKHGTVSFATSPTVQHIRDKLIKLTGIPFNHAVILLYRDGDDCIGFHKDKTLDLSTTDPIASISLGQERSYILKDDIFKPTAAHELTLTHGSLLLLGPKTNKEWYHSVPMEKNNNISTRISLTFRVVTTFKNNITGELKGQGAAYSNLNWPDELGGVHVDYYNELLDFWFGEHKNTYRNSLWWNGISPENKEIKSLETCDAYITKKWGKLLEAYKPEKQIDLFKDNHLLKTWLNTIDGTAALMILFDQFSRHVYRGTAKAFAFDEYAIVLAKHLLSQDIDTIPYKIFAYVTLMHSENIDFVSEATLGILKLANITIEPKMKRQLINLGNVSQQHLDIIKKYKRYPHRNILLGRVSTTEEIDLLANKKIPKWMRTSPKVVTTKKTVNIENIINAKTKLKILVLHSNRQTAQIFENKTKNYLEKKLKTIADLTYVDAPKLYEPEGEVKSLIKKNEYSEVPNVGFTRAWWNATDDPKTMVYRGLEQSLEYIETLFRNSDFDGIIGFSQGGTLTGIIAALVNDYRKGKKIPVSLDNISKKLQFVTIISGFYCRDTREEFKNCILSELPETHSPEQIKVRTELIDIPSFHIWGTTDTLVNPWRSEKLSEAFKNKKVMTHPAGHFAKAIKYWPIEDLCKWLESFNSKDDQPANYSEMCNKILSGDKINEHYLKEFTTYYPIETLCLVKYVIMSKSYSSNLLYELLMKLYLTEDNICDKILEIAYEYHLVWKNLIDLDTNSQSEKFRPILVKLIATEIKKEYLKYCVPSLLALYAPKHNSLYRKTRLFNDIAVYLASILNIYDTKLNSIKEDHDKRQKILSYSQYRKITTQLEKLLEVETIPGVKKHIPRNDLEKLLQIPVSDLIINPKAEPVDISPPELLEPLYTFLQQQDTPINSETAFTKGTICTDGRLDLCKQVIGPGGVKDLLKSLESDSSKQNPKVKHLLLGNNICGNELGNAVARFIKSGKSALTTWYIAGNDLDEKGIAPVCEALQQDKQVRQLWLKRNPLKIGGMIHIVDMLKVNTYLQVLDVTNTGILDDGAILLLNNIPKTLQYLYLSSNGLTDKTCRVLVDKLHTYKLEQLSLGCNRLCDSGAKYLGQALSHQSCSLKALEIASCAIGPEGAKHLADALKTNTSLIWLNFGFLKSTNDLGEIPNLIGSHGSVYIADALKTNKTLKALDLTYTGIQQAGIAAFAEMLLNNKTLSYLNIEQFGIPHNELSRELIRNAIRDNKRLLSADEWDYINKIIDPPHLEEIKSVYRVK